MKRALTFGVYIASAYARSAGARHVSRVDDDRRLVVLLGSGLHYLGEYARPEPAAHELPQLVQRRRHRRIEPRALRPGGARALSERGERAAQEVVGAQLVLEEVGRRVVELAAQRGDEGGVQPRSRAQRLVASAE